MNNQQIESVTQIIVRRISRCVARVFGESRHARYALPRLDLDWDENSYEDDINLESDELVLRDLEAEIYALTDQFNTEQHLSGASSV